MKIIRINNLSFTPTSHDDPCDPGAIKKVLLTRNDLESERIQMINWSQLLPQKAFAAHYHEDMEEIFIILNGKALITVDNEEAMLDAGDTVVIPEGKVHIMYNPGNKPVDYIALGIEHGRNGKTVVV